MAESARSRGENREASEETEPSPGPLHRDEVFHLLQNSRRRAVLRYLFERDDGRPVVMRDVAEAVAAWEHDTTVQQLTSTERQRVYISLYQSHLPKLAEYDLIDYEQSRGVITRRERANVLRPYLCNGLDHPNAEQVPSTSSPPDEIDILTKLSSLFD